MMLAAFIADHLCDNLFWIRYQKQYRVSRFHVTPVSTTSVDVEFSWYDKDFDRKPTARHRGIVLWTEILRREISELAVHAFGALAKFSEDFNRLELTQTS